MTANGQAIVFAALAGAAFGVIGASLGWGLLLTLALSIPAFVVLICILHFLGSLGK